MLKYILTTRCNRSCPYCISRNVKAEEELDMGKVKKTLWLMAGKHDSIMITGGEPTIAKLFDEKVKCAKEIFEKVYLTTQNKVFLDSEFFEAITFSLHDTKEIPFVGTTTKPVYAAILDEQYDKRLPDFLKAIGYSGLTINEEQRGKNVFKQRLPRISDGKFSIRVNKRGLCMNEDIILPDLKVINDFKGYL